MQEFKFDGNWESGVKWFNKIFLQFSITIMAIIWFRILILIDQKNKIIQARNSTLDVEVDNIQCLIADLIKVRKQWDQILEEAKLVSKSMAEDMLTEPDFMVKRIKKEKDLLMNKKIMTIPSMPMKHLKQMYFTLFWTRSSED